MGWHAEGKEANCSVAGWVAVWLDGEGLGQVVAVVRAGKPLAVWVENVPATSNMAMDLLGAVSLSLSSLIDANSV